MKRRDFLLLPGVIAMAWNQASTKVETPRIGFVQAGSRQENHALLVAFRDGLLALGWTDGSNISVLDRWAEERTEALPALVKELIGSGVTILVTAGTSHARRHAHERDDPDRSSRRRRSRLPRPRRHADSARRQRDGPISDFI